MILFPAIDLKEGRCVRLIQGDMAQATVFNDDPAAQAADFAAQGFSWLHLVDLDGAFAGRPMNAAAVEAILARITVPVQLGGGIRDMKTVEGWLSRGVRRIIIGTAAVRDPGFVREASVAGSRMSAWSSLTAAAISAGVRWRTKTGFPRQRTTSCWPGVTLLMSCSMDASASVSPEGFI